MTIDGALEIIELIDDDSDVFADRATNHRPQQEGGDGADGGRRWVGPAAAIALVALIGYGVVTTGSSNGPPTAEPAPSTTGGTTATTIPRPPTTLAEPPVPYYAIDPPAGYTLQYAEVIQGFEQQFTGSSYGLWATAGATADSGSWFTVVAYPDGGQLYADNAYRTITGEREMAVSHPPEGLTTVSFTTDRPSVSVNVAGFGIGDDELIRVAAGIAIDRDRTRFGYLPAGYETISTVDPWTAVQGQPALQLSYGTADEPFGGLGLSVGTPLGGIGSDRQRLLPFLLNHATPFEVAGGSAVAGELLGSDGYTMATWLDHGNTISLGGSLPVGELISIARTVHQVSAEQWQAMQAEATNNGQPFDEPTYTQGQSHPISFGTDGAGNVWTITASLDHYGDTSHINFQWGPGRGGSGQEATGSAELFTVVDEQRTYVLANVPRAVAATATLRVARAGFDPVDVPFSDPDPALEIIFGGYAFSEAVQCTASVIGPDGTVLATWPAS